jgi:hypothetical protein
LRENHEQTLGMFKETHEWKRERHLLKMGIIREEHEWKRERHLLKMEILRNTLSSQRVHTNNYSIASSYYGTNIYQQ